MSGTFLRVMRAARLEEAWTCFAVSPVPRCHPVGASGARLTLTILHELRRRGGKYGLAGACIGGGMGLSVIVEAYGN